MLYLCSKYHNYMHENSFKSVECIVQNCMYEINSISAINLLLLLIYFKIVR